MNRPVRHQEAAEAAGLHQHATGANKFALVLRFARGAGDFIGPKSDQTAFIVLDRENGEWFPVSRSRLALPIKANGGSLAGQRTASKPARLAPLLILVQTVCNVWKS